MRGNDDTGRDVDRPRPIFSRSADGRLRAGGGHVVPAAPVPDDEPLRKQAPVLIIPPQPQPDTSPAPHHLAIKHSALGPQASRSGAQRTPQQSAMVPEVVSHTPSEPLQHGILTRAERTSSLTPSGVPAAPGAVADLADVGDIWSEQERIRLQENWEEEERKKQRRQRRKELLRKKVTGVPLPTEPSDVAPGVDASKSRVASSVHTEPKEVILNISMPSMPKITLPRVRIPAMPRVSRKRMILFGGIAGIAVVGVVGYQMYQGWSDAKTVAKPDTGVKITHLDSSKANGKPDYDTVLPTGKTIKDFGGWVRVSPEDKNPVYAYADQISGVLVNVSEQPLPATFKADVDTAMDDLATKYSANDKQKVGSMTVYIGTSIKGPQSVLFAKGDLLILMKSASKITNNDWATYIRSLQ